MQDMITMPDGAQVKTLEELRKHFDLISVLEHYTSGKLLVWLKSLHCEEADIVADMNPFMPEFEKFRESAILYDNLKCMSRYIPEFKKFRKNAGTLDDYFKAINPFMRKFEETLCSLLRVYVSPEKMTAAYEKAARENCAEAQFRLGCRYLSYAGNREMQLKGVDLTKQAAEQGHHFAQYSLGNYYRYVEKRDDESIIWYQKAANQGYIEAMYALGTVESCLQAVERGHIRAQVRLGNFFFYGRGVKQDYGEAVKWYRKAAEQGDMEAQYRLILCYLTGKGVEKDDHEAAEWCARAGEKDMVPAEFRIGEWYFYGCDSGIEQDLYEAAKWYHRAYAKKDSRLITDVLRQRLAIIPGEKLVYEDEDLPNYCRKLTEQGYLENCNLDLAYNENLRRILSLADENGIWHYPIRAMNTIPSANPEDDVETLWRWRFTGKRGIGGDRMPAEQILPITQEQAHALWVYWMDQMRSDGFPERFAVREASLEQTLVELREMKIGIAGIENARSLVKDLDAACEWIGGNGPIDLLKYGMEIQQKFFAKHGIAPDGLEPEGIVRSEAQKEVQAAAGGGIAFCLGILEKRKQGKRLGEFTSNDWWKMGIETVTLKSLREIILEMEYYYTYYQKDIRGANIYKVANFTATPVAVASAYVTAAFGIAAQACQLRQGNITEDDFIVNSEVLCLDVSVSTIVAVLGSTLIETDDLGKIIGSVAGMFMYQIAKSHLSIREQTLIADYRESLADLEKSPELDQKPTSKLEKKLEKKFAGFSSGLEFAFDMNVNDAFVVHMAWADDNKQTYSAKHEWWYSRGNKSSGRSRRRKKKKEQKEKKAMERKERREERERQERAESGGHILDIRE